MGDVSGATRVDEVRAPRRWSRWLTAHLVLAVLVTAVPFVVPSTDLSDLSPSSLAISLVGLLVGLPWSAVLPLAYFPGLPVPDVVWEVLAVAPAFLNVAVHWAVLMLVRSRRSAEAVPPTVEAGRAPTRRRPRAGLVVLAAAVLGAAVWAAWLGWDRSYDTAADGTVSGPYTAAQVLGCAVTVGVVAALASLRWHPVAVAGGVTAGFWVCWTIDAALHDESGLFAVGAVLLLCGLVIGTALAAAVAHGVRALLRRVRPGAHPAPLPSRYGPPAPRDRWRGGVVLVIIGLSWLAAGAVLRHVFPLTWTFSRGLTAPLDVLGCAAVIAGVWLAASELRRRRRGGARRPAVTRAAAVAAVLLAAAVVGRALPAGDGFNGSVGVMAGAAGAPVAVLGACRGSADALVVEDLGREDVDVEVADPIAADLRHDRPLEGVSQVDLTHPAAGWSGKALRGPAAEEGELRAEAHGHQSVLTEVDFTRAEVRQLPPGTVLYTAWDGPDGVRTNHQVPLAGFRAIACASGRGWYT